MSAGDRTLPTVQRNSRLSTSYRSGRYQSATSAGVRHRASMVLPRQDMLPHVPFVTLASSPMGRLCHQEREAVELLAVDLVADLSLLYDLVSRGLQILRHGLRRRGGPVVVDMAHQAGEVLKILRLPRVRTLCSTSKTIDPSQ